VIEEAAFFFYDLSIKVIAKYSFRVTEPVEVLFYLNFDKLMIRNK